MIFKAEIKTINSMKNGTKITLYLDDEDNQLEEVVEMHKLKNVPVLFGIKQDIEKQEELSQLISDEQRKKIYALIKDIANDIGETLEQAKENLKQEYCQDREKDYFSLKDTEKENATEFVKWLIEFAFQNGVHLNEKPQNYIDDIQFLMKQSIKHKKCLICGDIENIDIHHLQGSRAGASGGRKNMDHSKANMVALCRKQHSEVESIGHQAFCEKYHIDLPSNRTHN